MYFHKAVAMLAAFDISIAINLCDMFYDFHDDIHMQK